MNQDHSTTSPKSTPTVRSDRRQVRYDRKRQTYLDEAMALVVEGGMERLTIARLADRMGASVGATYRYFAGKEALIIGLQEMAIADFTEFLQARLAAVEPAAAAAPAAQGALARLLTALSAYLEHAHASPRAHRLADVFFSFPEAMLSDAEAANITSRLLAPIFESFGGLLDAAVAAKAIDAGDTLQRTHVAWALVHGLDHFHKRDRLNPDHLKVRALAQLGYTTLFHGFGAKADAVKAAAALVPAPAR